MTIQRFILGTSLGMLPVSGVALGGDGNCTVYAAEASHASRLVEFEDYTAFESLIAFPRYNEVSIIDLSDKHSIDQVSQVDGPGDAITGVASYQHYLYYVRESGSVAILDLSIPSSPSFVAWWTQFGGFPLDLAVNGQYAVVTNWLFDGTRANRMLTHRQTENLGGVIHPNGSDGFVQMEIKDQVLFARAKAQSRIYKFNLEQGNPSIAHFSSIIAQDIGDMRKHQDSYLSFTMNNGSGGRSLRVLDITNPTTSTPVAWDIPAQDSVVSPTSLAMSETLAVVAFDDQHFEIYQLGDFPASEPTLVGTGTGMDYVFTIQDDDFVVGGLRRDPDDVFDSYGWVIAMDLSICCDLGGADLTGDGVLNFFDVSSFIGLYSAGSLDVDFTGDGVLDFFDVSAFINAFTSGCP